MKISFKHSPTVNIVNIDITPINIVFILSIIHNLSAF